MVSKTPLWGQGVVCAFAFAASVGGGVAQAVTITVSAGGDVQAAINAAQPGDVIALAAGATYVGNFVLPNKGTSTTPITIRSSTPDSQLPRAGVRMTPAYAPLLAKLHSPNNVPVLRTAAGAHHWTLMFLEFQANDKGAGDLIGLGAADSSQTQLSGVPYKLVIDRVYIHGDPALGQKRGIALNSADTVVTNSYISDCKAVGQDAQAISGYNGPGPYLIENNYLEGAAETVLFGGSDPMIANLVPSNITVRGNYMTKPLAWRNPIIAPPPTVSAAAVAGGGSLPAGTYAYKVVARRAAGMSNIANSLPTAEASATLGAVGAITISWSAVVGADNYVIYGRTAGGENTYWVTTSLFFTDNGAAGTAGTPPTSATKWSVKNVFELKNAQDVLIEGNVFENVWIAGQSGYAIGFTPRNQSGTAPWSVVQRVEFRNNLVRHAAGAVNILGHDSPNISQQTNHVTIENNVFYDISATWGSGSRLFLIGDGVDSLVIDHNTADTSDSSILYLYGASSPETNMRYTNNMSAHNSYGVIGDTIGIGLPAIAVYLPGGVFAGNVLAGGNAASYPTGNYFPSVAVWQAQFVDFAHTNYHLLSSSRYKNAGTDGKDLGANVDAIDAWVANATSGDNSVTVGSNPVQIITSTLPDAIYGQSYAQTLACSGGSGTCAWALQSSSLAAGMAFDEASATVWGTPTAVGTGSLTVSAWDVLQPSNTASKPLTLTVDAPAFTIAVPTAPAGQVGVPYRLTPSASGGLGTVSWTVSGSMPAGLMVDPVTGTISGTPVLWTASTTFTLQATDDFTTGRTAFAPVTITVAPAPLTVLTSSLPAGSYNAPYSAVVQEGGGTGSVTWALSGGGLPPGMTFGGGGALSGTPSAAGTFSFTVTATDTGWNGYVASASLSLTITAPTLTVVVPTPPAARVGQSYQLSLTANGAMGTVSWSIASGSLPSGLSLNASSGAITGIPSTAGSFSASVRATDSSRSATGTVAISVANALTAPVQEIVLYAAKATTVVGSWSKVADASAAGGYRMWNPNANMAKLTTPLAAPASYFELTFQADANTPYHLWVRGEAEGNTYDNDSFYVQFSGSVDASGAPINRIGTTTAAAVSIENGTNAGLSGWGWQDDSYSGLAGPMYFAASGTQTIRIQMREDGVSIDQIVLSAVTYATTPPGATKNDTTILPETSTISTVREIVMYAAAAPVVAGSWSKVADATAAGGYRMWNPDAGAAKLLAPFAAPATYFELTFNATAGVPYHLWMRGRADADYYGNDSVYVQFSGSVDASGVAIDRIGTTAAAAVSIEDGTGAGLSGWGWQDNAYGSLAPPFYFATSGMQTIRVQQREDGISIDQIVLSNVKYISTAPGATKNDTTVLPKQ
jgi:Putative Ig domain